MTKEIAEKITRVYDWVRFVILVAFLTCLFASAANAQVRDSIHSQSMEDRVASLEKMLLKQDETNNL